MSLRALVVDDCTPDALLEILTERGISFDHAMTGSEAMKFYKDSVYDLVVLDYDLPDSNGENMAIRIRSINRDQYIIGYSCGWNRDNAGYVCLDDYTSDEIADCIDRFLETLGG